MPRPADLPTGAEGVVDVVDVVGVIIPAAGASSRFGGNKLTVPLSGISSISRSIRIFLDRRDVAAVVVASDPTSRDDLNRALRLEERVSPRLHWCDGGGCRAESVLAGLKRLGEMDAAPSLVAIHDAARPAASQKLVERVFTAAREFGAAVPAIPVIDTIKRINREGFADQTLPRSELVAVQTPQAMRLDWLADAFERCPIPLESVTDDVQLLELAGRRVRVVEGEATNLKLTVPADVERLERILGG